MAKFEVEDRGACDRDGGLANGFRDKTASVAQRNGAFPAFAEKMGEQCGANILVTSIRCNESINKFLLSGKEGMNGQQA